MDYTLASARFATPKAHLENVRIGSGGSEQGVAQAFRSDATLRSKRVLGFGRSLSESRAQDMLIRATTSATTYEFTINNNCWHAVDAVMLALDATSEWCMSFCSR